MNFSVARPRCFPHVLGLALLATLAAVPTASAGPVEDFRDVFVDYANDMDVTACKFTRQQLQNARDTAPADLETYAPGFTAEVDTEIRRHDTGGCPPSHRGPGGQGQGGQGQGGQGRRRAARLRIARIRPRGGRRESVTIRNAGNAGARLRGYTLRDRSGKRVRLPRGTLRAGRSLRVFTGCARNRRRPVRRGGRFFACARGLRWDDRGDVVKLVTPRGKVIAQRGYGSRRRAQRI